MVGGFGSGESWEGSDVIDGEVYVFVGEGRNVGFESGGDFEVWDEVLGDVEE